MSDYTPKQTSPRHLRHRFVNISLLAVDDLRVFTSHTPRRCGRLAARTELFPCLNSDKAFPRDAPGYMRLSHVSHFGTVSKTRDCLFGALPNVHARR